MTDSTSNYELRDLAPRIYYEAAGGTSDLEEDKWYIDHGRKHAFKIYSDYDPIVEV